MSDLTATAGQERIIELDLMRGFAVFGILVVNMQFFGLPIYTVISEMNPFNDPADLASRFFIGVFMEGKFITLFSFLFGLGFWIFISRARARGRTAGPLFLRRLVILALFGAAHAFLFWAGDILLVYAILGLVMMLFLNRKDKTLRIWIVLLPVLHILFIAGIVALLQMAMNIPEASEEVKAGIEQSRTEMEAMAASAMEIYRTGTFTEMMEIRRQELAFAYQGFIMGGIGIFYLLAVFLAGMYAGRAGWFTNIGERLPALRRRVPWLLVLGMACAIPGYLLMRGTDILTPGWHMPLHLLLFIVGSPALISAYVILLLSAYHRFAGNGSGRAEYGVHVGYAEHVGQAEHAEHGEREHPNRFWSSLRDTGRMSLTVYLTQSLVMTTIFYGYGLGFYGSVPVWMMLPLAVSLFAIQMVTARWWMKHFTMGPLEWLWRAATYGYLPPLKKAK